MKLLVTISLLVLFFQTTSAQNKTLSSPRKIMFACPPCGCDGDTVFADKPGFCKSCGAALYAVYSDVVNEDKNKSDQPKTVAILVFPYAELIDFTGPWEVLAAAGMKVFSVAKNDSSFVCNPGLTMKPDYTFANCPQPDIVLIPGGGVDPTDTVTVNWIKSISAKTEHTVSVCTGAYLLGATGMLDHSKATTFLPAITDFKKNYPAVTIVDTVRFVDNGHILTSAGLTSGIDAAFHIVSLYQGDAQTQQLANLLEYNWTPQSNYVRGKLADKYLQNLLYLFTAFEYTLNKYQGTTNEWSIDLTLKTELTKTEIEKLLAAQAIQIENWKSANKNNEWTFEDDGKKWLVSAEVTREAENYFVSLKTKMIK